MCSYQNISAVNHGNILIENWEDELWANVPSLNNNVSDYPQNQCYEQPVRKSILGKNTVGSSLIHNQQTQPVSSCQNFESSSLMSPTWDDPTPNDTPQNSTNMSIYFSTFNPSNQLIENPVHQQVPVIRNLIKPEIAYNIEQGNLPRARINVVRSENGTFKAIVKRKRKRTVFTTEQIEALEAVFSKKPYVTREERQILVERLQVNDKSVKVWFQNRRLKHKRVDDEEQEVIKTNSCDIFERLDSVESRINERTDELGYVTLDDRIMNDLVNIIDDYFTSNITQEAKRVKKNFDSSPIYEPISPASTCEYSGEENSTMSSQYQPNECIQDLIDIDSIICT